MNLANRLTLARIALIAPFVVCMTPADFGLPEPWRPVLAWVALVVFLVAALTDWLDGALARRHGWVTDFGKLMDPLADKLLVMAAFVCLARLGLFAAWMVVAILAREFLVTGLRLTAASQGRVLPADGWGKGKTIAQMLTVIAALIYLPLRAAAPADGGHGWLEIAGSGVQGLMGLAVLLTLWSGGRYLASNRDLLRGA